MIEVPSSKRRRRSHFSFLLTLLAILVVALISCPSNCHGFTLLNQPPTQPLLLQQQRNALLSLTNAHYLSPTRRPSWPTISTTSSSVLSLSSSSSSNGKDNSNDGEEGIDLGIDNRLYRIRLPRAPGIEWGTDLSFSFVYVRAMDPTGPASMSGQVSVGDQLCELRPVVEAKDKQQPPPVNLIGAPFDFVMNAFAGLDKTIQNVDLVFFRGSKEDLKAAASGDSSGAAAPESVTITVLENKGSTKELIKTIEAPVGCNVREVLVDNDINVYQSITRWTNCKGKQLCGTCIVNITEGAPNTNRKSMDEESTLRENPDSYRLSCITFAYGDVTVETFPPIEAAQWTR